MAKGQIQDHLVGILLQEVERSLMLIGRSREEDSF